MLGSVRDLRLRPLRLSAYTSVCGAIGGLYASLRSLKTSRKWKVGDGPQSEMKTARRQSSASDAICYISSVAREFIAKVSGSLESNDCSKKCPNKGRNTVEGTWRTFFERRKTPDVQHGQGTQWLTS